MQVTTGKYNPLPMLWKPPPPSPSSILDKLLEAIYKINIYPVAARDSSNFSLDHYEMSGAARPYRVRPHVYLCDPRLFEEGLVD